MNEKIYLMKNHSISSVVSLENTFSLTINFCELSFDVDTYKLVDVFGFFPLINAIKTNISVPQYNNGEYFVRLKNKNVKRGEIYNYGDIVDTAGITFKNSSIYYDMNSKIICIGENDFMNKAVKVNDNIVCVVDQNEVLRCLYILIDRFE